LIERSTISATTATQIIRECIGETLQEHSIFKELSSKPFSLLLDGSSDLFGDHYLAIMVRYFENPKDYPVTKVLSVIELESQTTGLAQYEKLKSTVFDPHPDIANNLIAICTDGGIYL
jgi:ABC-type uncharacterized transport system ATPase subunit